MAVAECSWRYDVGAGGFVLDYLVGDVVDRWSKGNCHSEGKGRRSTYGKSCRSRPDTVAFRVEDGCFVKLACTNKAATGLVAKTDGDR